MFLIFLLLVNILIEEWHRPLVWVCFIMNMDILYVESTFSVWHCIYICMQVCIDTVYSAIQLQISKQRLLAAQIKTGVISFRLTLLCVCICAYVQHGHGSVYVCFMHVVPSCLLAIFSSKFKFSTVFFFFSFYSLYSSTPFYPFWGVI